jgi:hypothetical protein
MKGAIPKAVIDRFRAEAGQRVATHYVEVWVEKDAIAGVIDDLTSEWGVPTVCLPWVRLSIVDVFGELNVQNGRATRERSYDFSSRRLRSFGSSLPQTPSSKHFEKGSITVSTSNESRSFPNRSRNSICPRARQNRVTAVRGTGRGASAWNWILCGRANCAPISGYRRVHFAPPWGRLLVC